MHIRRNRGSAKRVEGIGAAKYVFPKTCFNPTCKCKELKIVREVTLRCSNCNCGVKVEEKKIVAWQLGYGLELFTVVKNGKNKS